jgi:hypothetical protein
LIDEGHQGFSLELLASLCRVRALMAGTLVVLYREESL